MSIRLVSLGVTLLLVVSCAGSSAPTPERSAAVAFTLTSPAFSEGAAIPAEYTCDGGDKPIPLAWSGVPDGTAELALVMDDPDARGFVHWVVVGIPGDASGFEDGTIPAGAIEGQQFRGPCPPSGTHHYEFTLYALSSPLGAGDLPNAEEVRAAAADKTLAAAKLTGTYGRQN